MPCTLLSFYSQRSAIVVRIRIHYLIQAILRVMRIRIIFFVTGSYEFFRRY